MSDYLEIDDDEFDEDEDFGVSSGVESVWELRLKGRTVWEIASELGMTSRGVAEALEAHVREAGVAENDEIGRAVMLDQLDRLYRNAVSVAMASERGAAGALGVALKAIQAKASLLGIEAPKRLVVEDGASEVDREIKRLVAELDETFS
jgi:predicted transcriptional regulator